MMYSAYKLNKQGDNIQPWHTLLPIWNQSVVPSPVLTVASWPAYRLLKRQVRWSSIPSFSRILKLTCPLSILQSQIGCVVFPKTVLNAQFCYFPQAERQVGFLRVLTKSEVAQSCLTLCDPMDCSPQGSLSIGFPRQEYWTGLPFPYPGDFPDPGIKPGSPALWADVLLSEPPGNTSHLQRFPPALLRAYTGAWHKLGME